MSALNESIVEDAAPTWFGNWAMRLGTGRSSRPANRRRSLPVRCTQTGGIHLARWCWCGVLVNSATDRHSVM